MLLEDVANSLVEIWSKKRCRKLIKKKKELQEGLRTGIWKTTERRPIAHYFF
jgi:hypothetical protein